MQSITYGTFHVMQVFQPSQVQPPGTNHFAPSTIPVTPAATTLTPVTAQSPHTVNTAVPGSSSQQAMQGPLQGTTASNSAPGSQGYPTVSAPGTSTVRSLATATAGGGGGTKQLAGVSALNHPRATSLPSASQAVTTGRKHEAASAGAAAPASPALASPSKPATASSVIAAAARANAAAASAIADSGALGNFSSGFAHGDRSKANEVTPGNMRPITPANSPSGPVPSAAAAAPAASPKASKTGVNPVSASGAVSTGKSGPLGTGQPPSLSASQAAFMTQQQRLNGMAMMTAMQQSLPGSNAAQANVGAAQAAAQAPAQAVASALRQNGNSNLSTQGQYSNASANPRFGSQPFLNPNFSLPSGSAPFRAPSNPSLRSAGPFNAGASVNPTFVPSSSALNPSRSSNGSLQPSGNSVYPGGSNIPSPSGLSISLPSPSSSKPSGSQSLGNPLSPSYKAQGLHGAAPETSTSHQNIGQSTSQASHVLMSTCSRCTPCCMYKRHAGICCPSICRAANCLLTIFMTLNADP